MKGRLRVQQIPFTSLVWAILLPPVARAQEDSGELKGINSGDYNIHSSIEAGYRASEINGNTNTYDTFENLGSGLRLFDYTLEMRSIDHNGLLFDNLSFSNFGYGGDSNDGARLRVGKKKLLRFLTVFARV